ncbi:DKNYY domain-containing protein [Pseudomonas syringae]|nr:DKNYY domain-containing protein [Pseudomonas syringae]MBD8799060.1 DKNYY domain-containing protein [Pseudomonas syringae]MBD8809886.1 DKNYY domain-containing protein [Pseudomonas syringae]
MNDADLNMDDWAPLALEWHAGLAFMEGVLLGDGQVPDVYIMLDPEGRPPQEVVQRAAGAGYPPSPLLAGQPVWRHRVHPGLLRDARGDHYLLPRYPERYGYHAVCALPFRFGPGLQDLGYQYWRDDHRAYWFDDYSIVAMTDVRPAHLALLEASPASITPASALFSDGATVFLQGKAIASADVPVHYCNHPAYRVIDGQVCRGTRPLWQKDGTPLPIAHPYAFRMLARRWGTDGESIIVQAQQGASVAYEYFYRIDKADLATFTVLNERYARDRQRGYYITGKTLRCTGDLRLLECWQPQFDACGRVIGASVSADEWFAVDDQHVYVAGTRLRDAHGPDFRHLGFGFYRDNRHAYQQRKRLDVDLDSFVVTQLYRGEQEYSPVLVGDRHGPLGAGGVVDATVQAEWAPFFEAHPHLQDYWWHRLQAPHANASEEKQALGSGFEVGAQVYFHGRAVTGLDAASFRLLDTHLCGDANGLYLIPFHNAQTRVPERFSAVPAEQYRSLGAPYLTDGERVFWHGVFYQSPEPMRKADLASFESCGHGWARDRQTVYYDGQAKQRLDPATTRILGTYAIGTGIILAQGKPLDVPFSPEEVRVPHPAFLQLGTRKLFYMRKPISAKRVDLHSLVFLNDRYARDQYRRYEYDGYVGLKEVSGDAWPNDLE